MRLRPTTQSDIAVLRRWDMQPHVIASGAGSENDDWDWDNQVGRRVAWRDMFIAEIPPSRPIGFVQLLDCRNDEAHYWGDCPSHVWAIDIWIGEPDCLNQGYGRQMMTTAIDRAFTHHGAAEVWIDPLAKNTAAHRFYTKMGFTFKEARSFGEDDCFIFTLSRDDWEKRKRSNA